MIKARGIAVAVVIGLLLGAAAGWSADQAKDRVQDQLMDQDKEQLQDGSCQIDSLVSQAAARGDVDRDRIRLQDGTGDCEPDMDRIHDRARDGSCLV